MKTRFFDHIDLRVKDRQRAQKFYAEVLPTMDSSATRVMKNGAVSLRRAKANASSWD